MEDYNIDWDKFPTATHYQPETEDNYPAFWEIEDSKALVCWVLNEGKVRTYVDPWLTNEVRKVLIERTKQEHKNSWYEKGELPPVGTEVIEIETGLQGVVITHVSNSCSKLAIIQGENDWVYGTASEFEPVALKEQIEKEKAVNEIASLIGRGTFSEDAERIWGAGYRKVVEQ